MAHRKSLSVKPESWLILLTGHKGAGKREIGTRLVHEGICADRFDTGDFVRKSMAVLSETDRVNAGSSRLVSDVHVEPAIRGFIARCDSGKIYVLDGYPRNVVQANAMLRFQQEFQSKKHNLNLLILELQASEEDAMGRRRIRGREQNRHDDLCKTSLRNGYMQYMEEVLPALQVLTSVGVPLLEVSAFTGIYEPDRKEESVLMVFRRVISALKKSAPTLLLENESSVIIDRQKNGALTV